MLNRLCGSKLGQIYYLSSFILLGFLFGNSFVVGSFRRYEKTVDNRDR